jgi:heterodisulfide reductase subunit C
MANLGLSEQLLKSPSLWLCLSCRRCNDYCSQLVSGSDLIRQYQDQAIAGSIVDTAFLNRLLEAERLIYARFLDKIDALLGLTPNAFD